MVNRSFSNIVLLFIVFIWVVPFVALITTSLRSEFASKTSGFWTSFTPTVLGHRFRTHSKTDEIVGNIIKGNIFEQINEGEEWFPISGKIESIMLIKF